MVATNDMRRPDSARHTVSAPVKSASGSLWRRLLLRIASANGFTLVRTSTRRSVTPLETPPDARCEPPGVVFEVPLGRCRYLYGGAYGPALGSTPASSGWHPFAALARQVGE